MKPKLSVLFVAEMIGTFLLVFLGCGSVHTAVVMGAQMGVWQVGIVWGLSIILAIFCVGSLSGAHINPAISIACVVWGELKASRLPIYLAGQFCGAFLAAATLYALFSPMIANYEKQHGVVRGQPESVITAMCYGEYYPNPGGLTDSEAGIGAALGPHFASYGQLNAFCVELLGTAILAMVVFAVTDSRNSGAPPVALAPVFIGLTVSALISVLAPLTQACFNPARDFAPRLFAYLAGWGDVALPGPNGIGFFTVYLIAPILGACMGSGLWKLYLQDAQPEQAPENESP